MSEHTLRVSEPRLMDCILLALHDNGLMLVKADGSAFERGYSPALAMAQSLGVRITSMVPAIQVVEIDDR
jgi:hypothetical protein